MNHLSRAAAPGYLIAAILLLFPLLDVIQAIWPLRPGDVTWRVLTAGLGSRVLVTPLLGLLLAYAAALVLEQRRAISALAVVNAVLAVVILIGLGAYGLDAVQMRAQLPAASSTNYDLGLLISFAKYAVALLLLVFLAANQWRTAKRMSKAAGRRGAGSTPLLVKTPGRVAAGSDIDSSPS